MTTPTTIPVPTSFMESLHGYIMLPIIIALVIVFLWRAHLWIGRALSEGKDEKGVDIPSSKRLYGFMITLTYCIAELMFVFTSKTYPDTHRYTDAGLILLLCGVTTLPQIVELWKGVTGNKDNGTNNTTGI